MAAVGARELAAGLAGGIAGMVLVHFVKRIPWSLAAIVGFAIAVLVVYSLRSGARIRAAWNQERWQRSRDDEDDSER